MVIFDPIKITVSSQAGDAKFGFDDYMACLRHLDKYLGCGSESSIVESTAQFSSARDY